MQPPATGKNWCSAVVPTHTACAHTCTHTHHLRNCNALSELNTGMYRGVGMPGTKGHKNDYTSGKMTKTELKIIYFMIVL